MPPTQKAKFVFELPSIHLSATMNAPQMPLTLVEDLTLSATMVWPHNDTSAMDAKKNA